MSKAMQPNGGFANAIASSAGLKLVSQLISWGVTVYALRTLMPSDYGVMATVTAFLGLILPFADNPLIVSLVRMRHLSPKFLAVYKGYCHFASVIAAVIVVAIALVFSLLNRNWLYVEIGAISSITCLAAGFKTVPEALLMRDGRVTERAVGLFIESLVSASMIFTLVTAKFGVFALAIAPLLGLITKTAYYIRIVGRRSHVSFAPEKYRRILKWTFNSSINEIVLVLGGNAPVLVAGLVLTPEKLGLFTTSLYLVMILVGKVMQIINPVIIALMSRSASDNIQTAKTSALIFGYVALISGPAFIGLAWIGNDFVEFALGPKWLEAGNIVSILALAMPVRMLFEFFATVLRARGKDRLLLKMQLFHLIPSCLAIAIGSLFSLTGIAIGFSVTYVLFSTSNVMWAGMSLGMSFKKAFQASIFSLGGIVVMSSGLLILSFYAHDLNHNLRMALTCLCGAALFVPFGLRSYRVLQALSKRDANPPASVPSGAPVPSVRVTQKIGSKGDAKEQTLTIFTFHRVMDSKDPYEHEHPTPKEFKALINSLSRNLKFLGLQEALAELEFNRSRTDLACITFDDGYRDNLTYAAPILADAKLPATLFLSTGHLDAIPFFVDVVTEAMRKVRPTSFDARFLDLGVLPMGTVDEVQLAMYEILTRLKYLGLEARSLAIEEILEVLGRPEIECQMLNTTEIAALHQSGFEIGAHTHSHTILTSASDEFILADLKKNCDFIENIIGSRPLHFAYPNGKPGRDFDNHHVDLVRDFGFQAAFSSMNSVCSNSSDRFHVPRVTVAAANSTFARFRHQLRLQQFRMGFPNA